MSGAFGTPDAAGTVATVSCAKAVIEIAATKIANKIVFIWGFSFVVGEEIHRMHSILLVQNRFIKKLSHLDQ